MSINNTALLQAWSNDFRHLEELTSLVLTWVMVMLLSHCVKSVQIRSFFWSVFFRIRTEYGETFRMSLREKCPNKEFFLVYIFADSDWIRRDFWPLRIWQSNWYCTRSVFLAGGGCSLGMILTCVWPICGH